MPEHNDTDLSASTASRERLATAITLVLHGVGCAGILWYDASLFARLTPLNLALMFLLLLYTHQVRNRSFYLFVAVCFLTGMGVELVGTRTGYLFGDYEYGSALGPGWKGVPYIIGINWFVVVYSCGQTLHHLWQSLPEPASDAPRLRRWLVRRSLVVDGALLAVFFDWLMEPVAVRLGYWSWGGDGSIPGFNYVCWFGVSALLLLLFRVLHLPSRNKFALHLLLIQGMFFLLLRTYFT